MVAEKVLIPCSGSRGDCQPYVALAIGLRKAGFETLLFTNPDHEKLCMSCNVPMQANCIPFKECFCCEESNKAHQAADFFKFADALGKQLVLHMPDSAKKLYTLIGTNKPDLIVCGTGYWGDYLWMYECFGIPAFDLVLSDKLIANTREAPFKLPSLCGCWNWMLWKLVWGKICAIWEEGFGKELSKLSGKPVKGLLRNVDDIMRFGAGDRMYSCVPYLIALDEMIVGRGPEVPPWVVFTGSMVIPRDVMMGDEFGEMKKTELDQFLVDGPQPVYFGWGSVVCGTQAYMCGLAIRSLQAAGCRGVIVGGWADLTLDVLVEEPDREELLAYCKKSVLFMEAAMHEDLFPQCAVLVHHGGSGTTVSALRSGRPMVITPILYDQFDFAKIVVAKGCGINAGHLMKVKVEVLAGHIKRCMEDDSIKQSAKTIRDIMHRQNGVEVALVQIQKFMTEEVSTGNLARNMKLLMSYRKSLQSNTWAAYYKVVGVVGVLVVVLVAVWY